MQNRILKIFFFLAAFLQLPFSASAAPSVSSVPATIADKQSVTISGSGFGSKTSPAPLVWDDCTGDTITDLWSGGWPSTATPSAANIKYSTPINGIALPHSHITQYLTGYHAVPNGTGFTGGYDVMVWKTLTNVTYPTTIYLSSYWQADPQWDHGIEDNNFKQFDFSNGSSPYTTSGQTNSNWYTAYNMTHAPDAEHIAWYTHLANVTWLFNDDGGFNTGSLAVPDNNGQNQYWSAGASPLGNWVKTEYEVKITDQTEGYLKVWDNGNLVMNYSGPTDQYTGTTKSIGLGGYARSQVGVTNSRYFADIYFDTTPQRVLACAGSAWTSRGLCEIQIPSVWNDTSVTVTINQGAFPDFSSQYLYVVDADGNANSSGYPITFGSGSSDIIPPTSPTGLSVS